MKLLIILTLFAIIASLGKALSSMSSGPDHPAQVVEALAWRIGLSVFLFVSLFVSYYMGWFEPSSMR